MNDALLEDTGANISLSELGKLRRVNKFLAVLMSHPPTNNNNKKSLFWTKENEEKLPSSTHSLGSPSRASC